MKGSYITTILGLISLVSGYLHQQGVETKYSGLVSVLSTAAIGFFAADAKPAKV